MYILLGSLTCHIRHANIGESHVIRCITQRVRRSLQSARVWKTPNGKCVCCAHYKITSRSERYPAPKPAGVQPGKTRNNRCVCMWIVVHIQPL